MSIATLQPTNPLVGTWVSPDEYGSTVEFQVSIGVSGLIVAAIDSSDGEKALISEIDARGGALSYVATWSSTGRVCKCTLKAASKNQVQFSFSYTEHGYLQRKAT